MHHFLKYVIFFNIIKINSNIFQTWIIIFILYKTNIILYTILWKIVQYICLNCISSDLEQSILSVSYTIYLFFLQEKTKKSIGLKLILKHLCSKYYILLHKYKLNFFVITSLYV